MRLWGLLPCIACLFAGTVSAQVDARAPAPRTLHIDGTEDAVLLAPHSLILEDPAGAFDLQQVRAKSSDWQTGRPDALVFGFSDSTWWVRVRIHNTAKQRVYSTIDLGNPRQDYVNWYVVRNNNSVETITAGDRLPFATRTLARRSLVMQLATMPNETVDLFMQLRTEDGLFEAMPVRLSRTNVFIKSTTRDEMLFTLCAGGLISLGLYNLLLFFSTRERVFGIYVLYLALMAAWSFTFTGYAFQLVWPTRVDLNHHVLTLTSAWVVAAFGWFAAVYLKLRERVPAWLYRTHVALIIYNTLVVIPGVFGSYALGAALGNVGGLAMSLVTLPTAIFLLVRGHREARFFVIAFSLLCIGICMYILQIVALVPTNWFTTWSLQIGSAIEALLLALGLADSLNVLKVQKFAAERRALEAQQALNARLEQQVGERTQALEVANRRLHELAITDELTGAFNRRHFNTICAAAIANRKPDESLAFCMFDIDHFKAYNDCYGHQAGDAALSAITNAIQAELRRAADVLFRLGGEEFGVVFDAGSAQGAHEFAERLRLAVRKLEIEHLGSPEGIVTASFGVGWWCNSVVHRLTAQQMYAVADSSLYAAKKGGRDRVEIEASLRTGTHPAFDPATLPPHAESA